MVLANNVLRGQADGYCQNSFPPSSKENRISLASRISYTFFVKIFLAASPWKIFTKKNAAAIQIRFEKRLQGQTATDVTHG